MNRTKRYVAAAMLALSLGVGGGLLGANPNMLAFTADAGMPWDTELCSVTNPCDSK